jgi:hypothetical protein
MTPTLRRLNDHERYWGLTWPGWCTAAAAAGVLYAAVKLSPFSVKPTVTIVMLLLAFGATLVLAVSGQALSPARHLRAIIGYRRAPKRFALSAKPDERGLVLAGAPLLMSSDRELAPGIEGVGACDPVPPFGVVGVIGSPEEL